MLSTRKLERTQTQIYLQMDEQTDKVEVGTYIGSCVTLLKFLPVLAYQDTFLLSEP